jgi:hypothetical protein
MKEIVAGCRQGDLGTEVVFLSFAVGCLMSEGGGDSRGNSWLGSLLLEGVWDWPFLQKRRTNTTTSTL